jgi:hypothetical protein
LTRVAVSGHREFAPAVTALIERAVRDELRRIAPDGHDLVGLSCLADGADQTFAEAVCERGGILEVITPSADYRDSIADDTKARYDRLIGEARATYRCDHTRSTAQAHMDAGRLMVDRAERLLAVWDGEPARGFGGTADVVAYARSRGVPVTVIWPHGAYRD